MTAVSPALHSRPEAAVDDAIASDPRTVAMARVPRDTAHATPQPLFVPMVLLALAIVSWFGFQTYQLVRERSQLAAVAASQQAQVDAAAKVRAALDALAASTQRLANAGNPNARVVVEELRKRGVTINPNPTPSGAPTPAP